MKKRSNELLDVTEQKEQTQQAFIEASALLQNLTNQSSNSKAYSAQFLINYKPKNQTVVVSDIKAVKIARFLFFICSLGFVISSGNKRLGLDRESTPVVYSLSIDKTANSSSVNQNQSICVPERLNIITTLKIYKETTKTILTHCIKIKNDYVTTFYCDNLRKNCHSKQAFSQTPQIYSLPFASISNRQPLTKQINSSDNTQKEKRIAPFQFKTTTNLKLKCFSQENQHTGQENQSQGLLIFFNNCLDLKFELETPSVILLKNLLFMKMSADAHLYLMPNLSARSTLINFLVLKTNNLSSEQFPIFLSYNCGVGFNPQTIQNPSEWTYSNFALLNTPLYEQSHFYLMRNFITNRWEAGINSDLTEVSWKKVFKTIKTKFVRKQPNSTTIKLNDIDHRKYEKAPFASTTQTVTQGLSEADNGEDSSEQVQVTLNVQIAGNLQSEPTVDNEINSNEQNFLVVSHSIPPLSTENSLNNSTLVASTSEVSANVPTAPITEESGVQSNKKLEKDIQAEKKQNDVKQKLIASNDPAQGNLSAQTNSRRMWGSRVSSGLIWVFTLQALIRINRDERLKSNEKALSTALIAAGGAYAGAIVNPDLHIHITNPANLCRSMARGFNEGLGNIPQVAQSSTANINSSTQNLANSMNHAINAFILWSTYQFILSLVNLLKPPSPPLEQPFFLPETMNGEDGNPGPSGINNPPGPTPPPLPPSSEIGPSSSFGRRPQKARPKLPPKPNKSNILGKPFKF